MKRQNKWIIEHIVQGNYGYGHGWEDECAEETRKEALPRLREYQENGRTRPAKSLRSAQLLLNAASK